MAPVGSPQPPDSQPSNHVSVWPEEPAQKGKLTMKKLVLGGAAVLTTAGIGLGLTQLANADPSSPKPTESSSLSVATGQASGHQGGPMDEQHGGPGGGAMGLRGVDSTTLAQKLGVEESKLNEAFQSIQQSKKPGGGPGQNQSSSNGSEKTTGNDQGQPPAAPPGESGSGDRDAESVKALAQALGLDESTVTTAIEEVRTEANKKVLDHAVSEGKLTQAEADAVTKAAAAGIVEVHGAGGNGPR